MNIKDIKQLAVSSFTNGNLEEKKVLRISKVLNRSDLRTYIKALKLIVQKTTVKISSSASLDKQIKKDLETLFKGKKIEISQDKNLLAGIRIQDFDNIYDLNLKNTLDSMIDYIKEN